MIGLSCKRLPNPVATPFNRPLRLKNLSVSSAAKTYERSDLVVQRRQDFLQRMTRLGESGSRLDQKARTQAQLPGIEYRHRDRFEFLRRQPGSVHHRAERF